MNGTLSVVSSFGVVVCFAASALGQAGAPTQRVHIPGIPDGTSIYPKSMDPRRQFHFRWLCGKIPQRRIPHHGLERWRAANGAGAPPFAATAPLVFRLQGDQEMLNFQVGHEVADHWADRWKIKRSVAPRR